MSSTTCGSGIERAYCDECGALPGCRLRPFRCLWRRANVQFLSRFSGMGRAPAVVDRVRTDVASLARYVRRDGLLGLRTVPSSRRLLRRPIVVGGCGRSGTAMLRGLIGAHTRVQVVERETQALCPGAYEHPESDVDGRRLRLDRLLVELNRMEIAPTAVRLVEKTPKNVRNYGGILRYFGDRVRIVNIV